MGTYLHRGVRACEQCGSRVELAHFHTRFCRKCAALRMNGGGKARARAAVARAVARGEMPRAASLPCVDCGRQALDYDHRDYSKPLDVEPVCRSCNKKRGPGLPLIDELLSHGANSLAAH